HKELPIWGVQFHPESVATKKGMRILQNFLNLG
ncbi:MAG: anthranilate/aminodeoxychorismate synthase component II, partial [Verrucomicrobiota bacterium]|nr:anthranilate/aminodeoxychorismate synthase component II [Verrucomicrobiota bacterium]